MGWYEGLPWAAIVAYTTAALAVGVALAYYGILVFERAYSYSRTVAEKSRIDKQIRKYIEQGGQFIDTPTAAAIWSGTLDPTVLQRHLCFRMIKMAIDGGVIKNPMFKGDSTKANMYTRIPLNEFVSYLKMKGVLD